MGSGVIIALELILFLKKRLRLAFLILTVTIIMTSIGFYNKSIIDLYKQQALFTVHQNCQRISQEIGTVMLSSESSLDFISNVISYDLTGPVLENPAEKILPHVLKSPFNVIEFIDADGNSTVYKNRKFNASNFDFFVSAMNGESGSYINYKPATFDDVLIDYYVPVKYNKKIIGVLVGGILSDGNLKEVLDSNFMRHKNIGLLVDSNFKIVASTSDSIRPGLEIKDLGNDDFAQSLFDHANSYTEDPFIFKTEGRTEVVCITRVPMQDYYVIQIVPGNSFRAGFMEIVGRMIVLIMIVILTITAYLVGINFRDRSNAKQLEAKRLSLINALSSTYQNMFVVNKYTGKFFVYNMDSYIRDKYKASFSELNYDQAISLYTKNEVFEDDHILFQMVGNVGNVVNLLADKNEYTFIYRVVIDGNLQHFQCHIFQSDSDSEEFVAGFKNVDDLIWTTEDQREMQTVQEALNAGAWSMDFDRNFQVVKCHWSEAFRRMIGYFSSDELPDRLDAIDPYIHEDDLDDVFKKLTETINDISGQKTYDVTFRAKTKNRGYRWFHVVGRIRRRSDGSPQHLVGLFVDVDEETIRMKNLISLASVYHTMHMIDLSKNTFVEISAPQEVKRFITNSEDAVQQMHYSMETFCSEGCRQAAYEFTDLSTLPERMKGKKMISAELISDSIGWFQISYVAVETDREEKPVKVIVTTMQIDEQKRQVQHLEHKANTDELTGFLNRHAYEQDSVEYENVGPDSNLVYVSIDVNGLKVVNDTLGHEAGDELLTGAAYCMDEAFGEYGKIYRVGGDEFAVVIYAGTQELERIQEIFREKLSNWKGKIVKEVSVSCGYVEKSDFPDKSLAEISKIADQRMYKDKARYYSDRGVDRRGQQVAFDAICQAFTKILKVNLKEDSFVAIRLDPSEKNALHGYSESISTWFKDFGKSGRVHPEDLDHYLEKTDLNYLTKYFMDNTNHSLTIYYRRKIGDGFHKVIMEMIPVKDFSEENQIVFLYVKNIEGM